MSGLVRLLRGYPSGGMPGIDMARELIPLEGGLGAPLQQFCLIRSLAILFYPLHFCGQYSRVGATISSARLAGKQV